MPTKPMSKQVREAITRTVLAQGGYILINTKLTPPVIIEDNVDDKQVNEALKALLKKRGLWTKEEKSAVLEDREGVST